MGYFSTRPSVFVTACAGLVVLTGISIVFAVLAASIPACIMASVMLCSDAMIIASNHSALCESALCLSSILPYVILSLHPI